VSKVSDRQRQWEPSKKKRKKTTVTYSDVGPVKIIENIHEPEDGEQPCIHLPDQRLFFVCSLNIVDAGFDIVIGFDVIDS
jgi:hypothetical protein